MATPDPLPELIAPLLDRPDRSGVFSDFDGTLSPIVDDPAAARPLPGALRVLARLARRYARVGIVSGRPVDVLAERLGPDLSAQLLLSGLYGLEVLDRGERSEHPEAATWRSAVAAAAERARSELPEGVLVEPKGMSLTLHFRTAPHREREVVEWAEREAEGGPLETRPARMSVELHPPVAADKGTAVAAAVGGLDAVCFLGDDVGDLPAFLVLEQLAGRGVRVLRVGVRSEEAPPELAAAVDVMVDGPDGAVALLERLAG